MSPLNRFSTRTKILTGVTALAGAGLLGLAGLNASTTADSAGAGPAGAGPAGAGPAVQPLTQKGPGDKGPGDKVPGDNGDVKVHRTTTPADDQRNEPHVCEFYLVGFNFDAGQQVSWKIRSWPPTGDRSVVSDGTLTLDADGHGRTADMGLPDGHYKLFWNFDGEHGKAKHKVFWVKCEGKPTPPETPKPTPTPTATVSPTTPPPAAPQPNPVETDFPVTG